MTDLTKLEIWIDEDHKTTAAQLLADNEGHADVADAVECLASHKDHTVAVGIGAGWTTLSVLSPVHHSLIDAVTRIQSATSDLHDLWSESGSDASDIMHDSPVNHWYPFNDDLGQVVFKMEAWRAVLAREKGCCPCDGCGEVVMSDETHGEGPEWLCGDCYIMWKKCAECGREMSDDECGDELPEERVCDTCAGIECEDAGCPDPWGDNGMAVIDGELHGPGVTVLWQLESETRQGVVSVWREFIKTPLVSRNVLTDEAGIQSLAMRLLKQYSE